MSTAEDSSDDNPRVNLSAAATRPFSGLTMAPELAAIRERLTAVAAELRQTALNRALPDRELLDLADRLDTLAAEESAT
ncbi:MAG: hypothetical protein KGM97_08915 [Alphaproteobacteria bacterium]|nr:hypothetical protein [Alphaproteobacteria bacterium]MDE2631096.1 hypothetical protein [Alphaproteobacteria bacterium]